MCLGHRRIFAASLVPAVAALFVVVGWLATSQRDFDVGLWRGTMIRFAADGFRFNGEQGGWEWTTTRVNVRGFIPDGWNASVALVRRPAQTDPWYPVGWFDQYLFSVRARTLVFVLLAPLCAWLVFRLRQRQGRGFPVGT
jgi:hypothetical protein